MWLAIHFPNEKLVLQADVATLVRGTSLYDLRVSNYVHVTLNRLDATDGVHLLSVTTKLGLGVVVSGRLKTHNTDSM